MRDDYPLFEDDPVLGKFVANFPSDRLRLLVVGGGVLAAVWFVVTVALWQVEETLASILTVGIFGVATLLVGWYVLHMWNREIVLYQRGFSYREGSHTAFIRYDEVRSIRQKAERRAYFGGLVQRRIFQYTIQTFEGETMVLGNLYRRPEELGARLEAAVNDRLRPEIEQALAAGERIPFSDRLLVGAEGLTVNGNRLPWSAFMGYRVQDGHLAIVARGGDWYRVRLSEVDNLRLLIDLLQQRQPQQPPEEQRR